MNREPPSVSHLLAVAAAMALGAMWVIPGLQRPVGFDGGYAYLPMARRLLGEGAAYLQRPDSLVTGILAYAYPALLGADERLIRWANVGLYVAVIALAFFSVRVAHSNRGGVAAAFLVAASPVLHPYIPDVMTEAPFVFLIAVWIASVAAVVRGRFASGAIVGGIALALATFTRPATTYFPLAAAIVFGWRAYRARGAERRVEASIALMHVVALALTGLFIARNAVEFGYPSVATGAGNALYQGVNALVDGFDPTYYGLTYDDGAATQGGFHLSIENDRLLRGVALEELAATPVPLVLEMWARKAVAFVFVAPAEGGAALLRAWRVALAAFALAALAYQRRSPLVVVLAGFAAYLVVVHMPIFYLHRYSFGLELPLALLAAIGIAEASAAPARLAMVATAGVLATAFGLSMLVGAGPGSPHPDRSPHEVVWSRGASTFRVTSRDAALEIPVAGEPRLNPSTQFMLTMRLAMTPGSRRAACTALRIRYKGLADKDYEPQRVVRVPITADGRAREITIGAYHPLRLNDAGVLRLEFECDSSATAEIGTIAILEPRRAGYYRQRYLERLKKAP